MNHLEALARARAKGSSIIGVQFKSKKASGIIYDSKTDTTKIAIEHYFRDFKSGVNCYYETLMSGDVEALQKFRKATS